MAEFDGHPSGLKLAMIGTGAMGGAIATLLAVGGEDIIFIDNDPAIAERANANGFHLTGSLGTHHSTVRAYTAAPQNAEVDVAIVLATTIGSPDAAKTAAQCLKPDGLAITMQNGIGNIEALQAELGAARVAAGSIRASAQKVAPAESELTKIDPATLGALEAHQADRVAAVAAAIDRTGFTTVTSENILGVLWSKLMVNVAINPLCATTGLVQGEAAKVPEIEVLRELLVREALAVASAKGITLIDDDPLPKIRAHTSAKYTKPSMLQHVEARRLTEIDAINGAIVREGEALGIPTPANRSVVAIVKGIERAQQLAAAG